MSSLDPSLSHLLPRDDFPGCTTSRAADYYGLGVRLGIYFAWFQAYIANVALPGEIAGALDTNAIFLLTLLVAMIKCSAAHMLTTMDGLVLMHLSGGTIFGILSIWGYRTRQYFDEGHIAIRHFGGFGTHSRLLVSLAVSIFGLWYWTTGVTGGLILMTEDPDLEPDEANPPECAELNTFMFAKVRADGGIRYLYMVICVLCSAYFGAMLLASSVAGWARLRKMRRLAREQRWAESSRLRYATGFKYRETAVIFKSLRVLNLVWLVFSIFLVEFTLNFNRLNGVLGGPHDNELHLPAQLLPLIIGAFGFVRIVYLWFETWRSGGPDNEPSAVRSATFRESRTMRLGVGMLQAFSPAMARERTSHEHDPEEIDALEGGRAWPVRYLVAWLPWLSLLKFFNEESAAEERKRLSGEYPHGSRRGSEPAMGRGVRARQGEQRVEKGRSFDGSTVHEEQA